MNENENETAPRIAVRNPDQPILDAIDELEALASGRIEYVTDETRKTVRRITGMTVNLGPRWTPRDRHIALEALRESVA